MTRDFMQLTTFNRGVHAMKLLVVERQFVITSAAFVVAVYIAVYVAFMLLLSLILSLNPSNNVTASFVFVIKVFFTFETLTSANLDTKNFQK